MSHVTHWQAKDAGAAIAAHRIVTAGAAGHAVIQAAASSAPLLGIAGRAGGAAGGRVEIARQGIAPVEYGAAVAAGDFLTADADGKAIPLTGAGIFHHWADGVGANANMAVTGILLTDELIGAWELASGTTNTVGNLSASIHADGQIRVTVSTSGDRVLVTWRRVLNFVGIAEIAGVAGDIGEVFLSPGER